MSITPTLTAPDAFRALQTKVRCGGADRADTIIGAGTHGEDFILDVSVPDQMVVQPHRRVETHSRLRVAILSETELAIQLLIRWRSVFGDHASVSAYKVTLDGNTIAVRPRWEQAVPSPALKNIDVHTGSVTASVYHRRTIDELRSGISSPVGDMLFDGNVGRPIDSAAFTLLAARIMPMVIEF